MLALGRFALRCRVSAKGASEWRGAVQTNSARAGGGMTARTRSGSWVAVFGLSLVTCFFAASGQVTGAAGDNRREVLYSLRPGYASDLKGVSTVFVLADAREHFAEEVAERIGDLPLRLTESVEEAD